MNYLPSRRGSGLLGRHKTIAALILIIVLVLLRGPLTSFLFPVLTKLASPLWGIRDAVLGNPTEENREVESEILEARLAMFVKEEGLDSDSVAHILSSLAVSPYGTVLIDRGSTLGTKVGDVVTTREGVLLGEVVEVFPESAKFSLHSVFGQSMEVTLEDSTHFFLVGTGNQNFEARLPSGLPLEVGQHIYSPGADHYILARVERVESLSGAAFQKMLARSPVNIHALSFVYVRPRIQ